MQKDQNEREKGMEKAREYRTGGIGEVSITNLTYTKLSLDTNTRAQHSSRFCNLRIVHNFISIKGEP